MNIFKTIIIFSTVIPQIASAQLGGTLEDVKDQVPYSFAWEGKGLNGFPESKTYIFSGEKMIAVYLSVKGSCEAVAYKGVKDELPPFSNRKLATPEILSLLKTNHSGEWHQQKTKNGQKSWNSSNGRLEASYAPEDCVLTVRSLNIPDKPFASLTKNEMQEFERYIQSAREAAAARIAETGP